MRYQSGTLPTDYGFTHQRADATSGLDYYGARYYDPVAGQFTSADTMLAGGLNRYGYVGGNPESATDPSGHVIAPQLDYQKSVYRDQVNQQPAKAYVNQWAVPCDWGCTASLVGQATLGTDTINQSYHVMTDPHASVGDRWKAAGVLTFTVLGDGVTLGSLAFGQAEVGAGVRAADEALLAAETVTDGAVAASKVAATGEAASDVGNVIRYRGTTVASASDVVDNQAIDVERIQHFQINYTPPRGPGVYCTSQPSTAAYYADLAGGSGRGMGPAVISMEVAPEDWSAFVQKWSVEDNVPIIGGQSGQVETVIPFEAVPELNSMATFSWAR